MPPERIVILVDGSNMYHYLRGLKFRGILSFDYKAFAHFLARGRHIVSATYYIGKVRPQGGDAKGEELRRAQQRLFAYLHVAGWHIEYGHMLKNNGVFQEKGVDVHMAVDLVTGAYDDRYDTAVLVSSDTDLIPAVHSVRSKKKKVEYIGFAHRPSFGLMKNVSLTTTLRREDLKGFFAQEGKVHEGSRSRPRQAIRPRPDRGLLASQEKSGKDKGKRSPEKPRQKGP